MPIALNQVKGIGPATAEKLAAAGIPTANALAACPLDKLMAVPGFGNARAVAVIAQARQLVGDADDEPAAPTVRTASAVKIKKNKASKKKSKTKKKDSKKKKVAKKEDKKEKQKAAKAKKDKSKKTKSKKSGSKKKSKKKK